MKINFSPLITRITGPTSSVLFRDSRSPYRYASAGPRLPHQSRLTKPTEEPCQCQSFKKADLIYQMMSTDQRAVWKAAVKKPHTSPYNLFMKEAMSLFVQDKMAPDIPSVSGGFSTRHLIEGDTWHAPDPENKPYNPDDDDDFNPPWPRGIACPHCTAAYTPKYMFVQMYPGDIYPCDFAYEETVIEQNAPTPCFYPVYEEFQHYEIHFKSDRIQYHWWGFEGAALFSFEIDAPYSCKKIYTLPWQSCDCSPGGTLEFPCNAYCKVGPHMGP